MGGGMGMDGAGRRQRPPCQIVPKTSSNEVVGDKDVERGVGIFCKIIIVCFLSSDIDHTVCITRWQAHHHHQLVFCKGTDDKFADY